MRKPVKQGFHHFAFPNTLNLQLGYEAGHMWCSLKIFMEFSVAARFPRWTQTESLNQSQPAFKWTRHYKKLCLKGHPRRSNTRFNQCPLEFSQFTSNKTNVDDGQECTKNIKKKSRSELQKWGFPKMTVTLDSVTIKKFQIMADISKSLEPKIHLK